MKTHPIADLFPMMADDELAELADDIKANGLIHPIITDGEGQLIDGRNRLKACKLAGIEPRFEKLNGQDPIAYIYSANIRRRNLTKSQRVMLVARMYPDTKQGKKRITSSEKEQVPKSRLSYARAILRYSEELADSVIKGSKSLDEALDVVKKAQERDKSDEENLAVLRKEAADLAELVDEAKLKLDEAIAALEKREEEKKRARERGEQVVQLFTANTESMFHVQKAIDAGGKPVSEEFIGKLRNAVKEFEQCLKRQS